MYQIIPNHKNKLVDSDVTVTPKMVKLLPYDNSGPDNADDIISRWIVMNKLGIIEECEIFDDFRPSKKYQNNDDDDNKLCDHDSNNNININFGKVILVQKLWKSDLKEYIETHQTIHHNLFLFSTTESIAQFMHEIVPKIKLIHDNGLILGDINDENFVVDYEYDDIDMTEFKSFGIIDFNKVNEIGVYIDKIFGTPGYIAPEIRENKKIKITTKMDIFSLGMTLLTLIYGYHPYHDFIDVEIFKEGGDRLQAIITQKLLDEILEEIFEFRNTFALKHLLRNMVKYKPEDRYDINDIIHHEWYQQYCTYAYC